MKSATHRHEQSLSTIVIWLVRCIFILITVGIPVLYFEIYKEYEQGLADSEARMNAGLIAELIKANPETLFANDPEIARFAEVDVIDDYDDDYENRRITSLDEKHLYEPQKPSELEWPIVSTAVPIKVNGQTIAYFNIERSMSEHMEKTVLIAFFLLVITLLANAALYRKVFAQLIRAEEDIAWKAAYDLLTGLPNRDTVINELNSRLARMGPYKQIAVLFIDLDRFKAVNDTHGHAVGDAVLKAAGKELRKCLRSEDFLGRLAGDEFVVLIDLIENQEAIKRIAESITRTFSRPHLFLNLDIAIGATIGVAIGRQHGTEAEELLQKADTAMYIAKAKGRGGWEIYEAEMTAKVDRELHLRGRLQQALERNEFELFYQPIVDLCTGEIAGAEALLRWNDSKTGTMVSPAEFIPELESTGLIITVGEWVMQTACSQLAAWKDLPQEFYVSVNVSARQFTQRGFGKSTRKIITDSGVDPQRIMIELTESMLISEGFVSQKRLQKFKEFGTRLAIDDFGTGFSSLARIADMPFDVLKVDRKFVKDLERDNKQSHIVLSMLTLAKGLDMEVIAEGVETENHREILCKLGCLKGQGFLFARPMSASQFEQLYLKHIAQTVKEHELVPAPLSSVDTA